MNDDFKSLKQLGKKVGQSPTPQMMTEWTRTPFKESRFSVKKSNWWQLAAALIAGILIGKFILQSSPEIFSMVAKNHVEDETFEYVYINN
ncbi:MAG: hypothetical protein B7Y39_06345 [Bdellovibrio sp. 28-41-41]|nr:MAG: hypothetical protein B7Y39_06345 [Bdellovibrio sp. 28-41-41]